MQTPTPDVLTAFETSQIQADTRALLDDSHVNVEVTYTSFSSATFDAEAGTTSTTATTSTVNALRGVVTAEKMNRLSGVVDVQGTVEVGDRMYLIDQADISEPSTEGTVTEGSVTREVVGWSAGVLNDVYLVTAREQ